MNYQLGQRLRDLPGPVLLTGHTGFKGTWMTFLLEHLDVPVVGYSLPAEKDSLYDRAERVGVIPEKFGDILNYELLEQFIDKHNPSTIIHMAAQPLVLKSYENPRATFDVNVMGTANVLDIAFKKDFIEAIVIVTTDKVYKNDDSGRAFIETDPLGGKDPYSASKVGTEAVVAAWQQIAKISGGPQVYSARAGNVIGGGDFAESRLIPDIIRGLVSGSDVEIRNPGSTRPWQHVIDPLIGYISLLERIGQDQDIFNLNFGPLEDSIRVREAVTILVEILKPLGRVNVKFNFEVQDHFESKNLSLDSGQAKMAINWSPVCNSKEALVMTGNWWIKVLKEGVSIDEAIASDLQHLLVRMEMKNAN